MQLYLITMLKNFAIDLPREVKEDLNTYYVALSRAKQYLIMYIIFRNNLC